MNKNTVILIAQVATTFYMVGLIWLIQIVHYPLFELVGSEDYVNYQIKHQAFITPIVAVPMIIELVSAILLYQNRPAYIPRWTVIGGLMLVVVVWLSTAFIQVPCHNMLSQGFDPGAHQWLVNSNWIRTVGWTARGVLMIFVLSSILKQLDSSGKSEIHSNG